ncbi:nuclear transport factor 2 family protein [Streptomyces sp. NPDC093252]|uniref:nuclear transport factor 2 family protein n=1 Tax=Streptomyces sp. NPDC093252 TaxID=3154980 RepID=UPI00341D4C45
MNRTLRIALPVAAAALLIGGAATQSALATSRTTPAAASHAGHASGLSAREAKNTKAALALLDITFNQHDPRKAAEKYISAETYIQHNPHFGNGRDAFIAGATAWVQQNPGTSLDFKRTVTQGDLVVVQGLSKLSAGDRGTVEVDTFRFDRHGKIVEHWDALQPVAETSANGNPQV